MIIVSNNRYGHRVAVLARLDSVESEKDNHGHNQHTTRIRVGESKCPHDFVGRNFATELELYDLYEEAVKDHLNYCDSGIADEYESTWTEPRRIRE